MVRTDFPLQLNPLLSPKINLIFIDEAKKFPQTLVKQHFTLNINEYFRFFDKFPIR